MSTQTQEGVTLSDVDIVAIVAEIQEAKAYADRVKEFRFARLNGALSMILRKIDKRMGEAVWME